MSEEDEQKASNLFRKDSPEYEEAIALVGGTVGRAKALFRPRAVPCEDKARRKLHQEKRALKPYTVALVPYPIAVKSAGGLAFFPGEGAAPTGSFVLREHAFDHFDLCVNDGSSIDETKRWSSSILERCKRALDRKADFVVLSELSYPSFWPGRGEPDIRNADRRRALGQLRSELDVGLQRLASDRDAVIICGSYHDWDTFENISPIYFPDPERSRNHKKRTSAYVVHEHIKTAHGVYYPVYQAIGRTFCVLICTDAFDLNMFFRQVIAAGTSNDAAFMPELYFVPSFFIPNDAQHALRDACRQLSLATGQIVAFANHAGDEDGCAIYVAGDQMDLQARDDIFSCELSAGLVNERRQKTDKMRRALNHILKSTRRTVSGGPPAEGAPSPE